MRIAIVCPGRGSYSREELGSLARNSPPGSGSPRQAILARADALREAAGRTPVSALDRAATFSSAHLKGENAAALIFTAGAMDLATLPAACEVVAACGNSMGFYTALLACGALDFDRAFRLADAMGSYQAEGVTGGQIVYPLVNEDWREAEDASRSVEDALAEAHGRGFFTAVSIRLGGYAVLAGDDDGIRFLRERLPEVQRGGRAYPLHLAGHSAFHTELMAATSARALRELADLEFDRPAIPLVDGRGAVFGPLSTRPAVLKDYTLRTQVVEPFDFTASVRVLMREFAPQALVLLSPGDSLGGSIGQILAAEGWGGIADKASFRARQQSPSPILYALGRSDQAAALAQAR